VFLKQVVFQERPVSQVNAVKRTTAVAVILRAIPVLVDIVALPQLLIHGLFKKKYVPKLDGAAAIKYVTDTKPARRANGIVEFVLLKNKARIAVIFIVMEKKQN
jgi:hypothetical protein